ncbi:hypothetical protein K402DRAFT_323457 [Aulographum hederae CBS 113979]|uniref:Inactive metallocarboxypeptidase ECM14 n=1 Tax=Aulographum hederae CBS 113979 TaxID=1176131 RepID=A0A6G1HCS9_9PEZI|nr:hypothetical protein K402DRAFT_323457 [Aulographum hederae CBS 113979]
MRHIRTALLGAVLCCRSVFAQPHLSRSDCDEPQPAWRRISNSIFGKILDLPKPLPASDVTAANSARNHGAVTSKVTARYGGDLVLRFNITNGQEASSLAEAADILFLDLWDYTENWVDIRLSKDVVPSLLGLLPNSLQRAHVPLLQEQALARAIAESYPTPPSSDPSLLPNAVRASFNPSLRSAPGAARTNLFFSEYQPYSVIVPWMRLMASMFTTHTRLVNIGISHEGRDIPALRVGVHPTNDNAPSGPRRTILITGGAHAREWISTSTVLYVAYQMITSYGKSALTNELLESFDWVFVPTMNPDGYVYTWESDRLWRKNRQPTSVRFCKGLDLDRSWNFQWDGNTTRENPCSESFAGEEPFQGVESKRFADWARNETENNGVVFTAFLDLHSYSQQVLYPYSYTCESAPPTLENLEELALGLAKAMRLSHGGRYQYKATAACEGNVMAGAKGQKEFLPRMETGGGSALDWFYNELKVSYAYQLKLRDTGSYGFLLPKENIIPTGKEVLDAMYYLGRYLSGKVGLAEENDGHGQESRLPKLFSEEQDAQHPFMDTDEQSIEHETKEFAGPIHLDFRRRR